MPFDFTFDGADDTLVNAYNADIVGSNNDTVSDLVLNGAGAAVIKNNYRSDNIRHASSAIQESWIHLAAGYVATASGLDLAIHSGATNAGVRVSILTDGSSVTTGNRNFTEDGAYLGIITGFGSIDLSAIESIWGLRRNAANPTLYELVLKRDGQADIVGTLVEGANPLTGGNPGFLFNRSATDPGAILRWSDSEFGFGVVTANAVLRLRPVDASDVALPDETGFTVTVFDDHLLGTELHQGTADIVSGNLVLDDDLVGAVSDENYFVIHKDGATRADDLDACGYATIVDGNGSTNSDD